LLQLAFSSLLAPQEPDQVAVKRKSPRSVGRELLGKIKFPRILVYNFIISEGTKT